MDVTEKKVKVLTKKDINKFETVSIFMVGIAYLKEQRLSKCFSFRDFDHFMLDCNCLLHEGYDSYVKNYLKGENVTISEKRIDQSYSFAKESVSKWMSDFCYLIERMERLTYEEAYQIILCNGIKEGILHDYRDDILEELNINVEEIKSWSVLYKTLLYELDNRTGHVEKSDAVISSLNNCFLRYNQYTTADIMNGWWEPFKYLFGIKSRKNVEQLKKILIAIEGKEEKDIFDNIPNENRLFSKVIYESFFRYLKCVYTIGNITPSYNNKHTGYLDSWEPKMYGGKYKWENGDFENLRFTDYTEDIYITPKMFKKDPLTYLEERVELIIKRALRINNIHNVEGCYNLVVNYFLSDRVQILSNR